MDAVILSTVGLLSICVVVAIVARRIRLPYTVGLIVTGIGIALLRYQSDLSLTRDFIFFVILPPLIFEAALTLRWSELRRDLLPVLVLAIFGALATAAVVAAGIVYGLGWPPQAALVFGVLIAATDPVSVIAMFKDTGITGRLRLLVESESLLNDGVAAVLFALALSWAQATGAPAGVGQVAWQVLSTAGGGLLIGLAAGAAAILVAGRTADHLVETALTTVAAYGSFLAAEHLGMSGVLAALAAGLLMGNLGVLRDDERNALTSRGREFVIAFWNFAAFVANSLIFLMIGLTAGAIPFEQAKPFSLAIIIALVLFARAATVYPLCLPFARSRWAIPLRAQHVLWWGGLRGALCLALALSLPLSLDHRNDIIIAAFGVVAFSVIVAGMTMPLMLRWLGFIK